VCCGESVDVYNPKVVRASAGSVLGIPIVERRGTGRSGEAGDPVPVLDELAAQGRKRYGATSDGVPAYDVELAEPVALVLGNEAHGLAESVLEHVDGVISIPMAGEAESLNVAMAGTVLAFEAARQRAGMRSR